MTSREGLSTLERPASGARPGRLKRLAFFALTVFIGGVVFSGFAEIMLRTIPNPWMPVFQHIPDETLGWAHRKDFWGLHTSPVTKNVIRTNEFGMADRPRALAKSDRYRIAVLGGSYAVGHHVPHDRVFSRVMEDRAPGIEVLNFAVAAYGTTQQLLQYRTLVRRFSPDLVIVVVAAYNDPSDNSIEMQLLEGHPMEEVRRRPFLEIGEDGALLLKPVVMSESARAYLHRAPYAGWVALKHWLVDNVMIMRFLYLVKEDVKSLVSPAPRQAEEAATPLGDGGTKSIVPELARERANRLTERVFQAFAADVRADGGQLLLVSNSSLDEVAKATSGGLLPGDHIVKGFADAAGAMFLPLSPCYFKAMRENGHDATVFKFDRDAHWSIAGHALAAHCILGDLQRRRLIPPPT